MATVLAKVAQPCYVKQIITAGNDFDGTEPTTAVTYAGQTFTYATHTAGGLFKPSSTKTALDRGPWVVVGIEIDMSAASQSAWTVELIDAGSSTTDIASGTTETSYVRGGDDPLVLIWGEGIKITTTGASGAINARVKFAPFNAVLL